MKRFLTIASLMLLGLLIVANPVAAAQKTAKPAKKPNIDLVICLDVSGSMNGLIQSAKVKLWDIVNELGKAKPTPNLRIALYSYGASGYNARAGYVRKDLGFTDDLDLVYKKLFQLRTGGGTELVARVSQAALDQLTWSKDPNALRLIFVCGNESAAQDRQITLETVASRAVKRGVIINTIHCQRRGTSTAEIETWQKLSRLAEGRFVSIDQNRGAVAINTPVDKRLAELGGKLNKTYVWYGRGGKRRQANQIAQDKNARKLGKAVEAARAKSKAGGFYRMATADLVDRLLTNPKFDITKVAEKELPDNLKKMKPAERVKYVKKQLAERVSLQKEIMALSKKRDAYIRAYMKKNQNSSQAAFGRAIQSTLRSQAKKKGIAIPK